LEELRKTFEQYRAKANQEIATLKSRLKKLEELVKKSDSQAHQQKSGQQSASYWRPKDKDVTSEMEKKGKDKMSTPNVRTSASEPKSPPAWPRRGTPNERAPAGKSPPSAKSPSGQRKGPTKFQRQIFIKGITDRNLITANADWILHYFAETSIFEGVTIQEVSAFENFRKQGIVRVTLGSEQEVMKVLRRKSELARVQGFSKVYIEKQQSREERERLFQRRVANRSAPRTAQHAQVYPNRIPPQSNQVKTRYYQNPDVVNYRDEDARQNQDQYQQPLYPQSVQSVQVGYDGQQQVYVQEQNPNGYHGQRFDAQERNFYAIDPYHLNVGNYTRNHPPIPVQGQIPMRTPIPNLLHHGY
jgi:hypothetical protein